MSNWTNTWTPGAHTHYRRRVVDVEAFRLGHESEPQWFTDARSKGLVAGNSSPFMIFLADGKNTMRAWDGDWVIREILPKGVESIHAMHHDLFSERYEPTPEYAKLQT